MVKSNIYQHIIPRVDEWPINHFSKSRATFIEELNAFVFQKLTENKSNKLEDILAKTIYLEGQRSKNMPWKSDPQDDAAYWKNMGLALNDALKSLDKEEELVKLTKRIINRYNEEVVGGFKPSTFLFARRFLTVLFKILFNKFKDKGQGIFWGRRKDLVKRIKFVGHVEETRSLFKKGTVVVVPTHFSNLDSIMIGASIDFAAGLPAFAYGAGLNLFDYELAAYFMNRLGAYRVDRRKKNPIYLECLTSMVSFSLFKGVNNIFFPGGTRSRSGAMEDRLKLGLLGSVIDAQRLLIESGKDDKIFVVPLILSYNFVLEAGGLIEQHLQLIGKEKYNRSKDGSSKSGGKWAFIKSLFYKDSEIVLSFGEPMDVLGNKVDDLGVSTDKNGKSIDIKEYFVLEGQVTENAQRENVYTKLLGDKIVQSYFKNNVVLASHVAAFVAFQYLLKLRKDLNLFAVLRLHAREVSIEYTTFKALFESMVIKLHDMEKKGQIFCDEKLSLPTEELIDYALTSLGIYHPQKVLKRVNDKVLTENLKLLYFYSNRLEGYQLDSMMDWSQIDEFRYVDKIALD